MLWQGLRFECGRAVELWGGIGGLADDTLRIQPVWEPNRPGIATVKPFFLIIYVLWDLGDPIFLCRLPCPHLR